MKKHINIRVMGEVQGVFFRASAREKAVQLHINGLVRNEKDGSVYLEAEGEESDLSKFLEWCQRGPIHAKVDRCEVTEATLSGYEGFHIQRFG
jgi:acylphosphatase